MEAVLWTDLLKAVSRVTKSIGSVVGGTWWCCWRDLASTYVLCPSLMSVSLIYCRVKDRGLVGGDWSLFRGAILEMGKKRLSWRRQ